MGKHRNKRRLKQPEPIKKELTKPKNSVGSFSYTLGSRDSVVLPNDLYYEQSETTRALFDVYDYLPFIQVGEIEHFNALINNSATAKSIVSRISTLVVGNGFYLKNERNRLGDEKTIELTEEQKEILWNVLTRKNTDGDDLLDVCKKCVYDYAAFGNTFATLDVINLGTDSDWIVFVSHGNTNFIRPFRSLDLKTRFYGVSLDWALVPFDLAADPNYAKYGQDTRREMAYQRQIPAEVENVMAYPRFTSDMSYDLEEYFENEEQFEIAMATSDKKSMLHVKQYAPQMYFWGLPVWVGGKHWMELEYRIAKFNISKFKNGLTPSGILQLFGDLDDQTRNQYLDDMRSKMTDTGNDFKVIFQILENPEMAANWIPFEQSYQGFFMELAQLCKEFIAVAFEFPLSMVQSEAGKLGNNQQIRSEFETLYNTTINAYQHEILEGIVKPYLHTVAEEEGYEFLKEVELGFLNIVPVSFAGDLSIKDYVTIDEGREILGLSQREEGELTVAEEEEVRDEIEETEVSASLFKRFLNFIKRSKNGK